MPRPADQPPDPEPAEEKAARSAVTVRELYDQALAEGQTDFSVPEEPFDFQATVDGIGPERWAELRERRDRILAELRSQREGP